MSSTPKRRAKSKLDDRRSSLQSVAAIEPPSSFFPSKEELLKLLAVIAIASAVAVSCNFFASLVNPHTKPFCDSDLYSPDPSSFDSCHPCPSHGDCRRGELQCINGYRMHGRSCVEDGSLSDTAKQLANWVEARLCEAYARLLCGEAGIAWVQEADILRDLDEQLHMKDFGGDSSLFMYTKIRVMETIVKLLDTRANSAGTKEFKCPDVVAEHYKPYSCRIHQWVLDNALLLVPICTLLVSSIVLIGGIRKKRRLSSRAEELYHQICDILEENALSEGSKGEPWVVAARLRDHLLLPKERKDPVLWKKVEEMVEEDSRVDRYPKLVKGEQKVVWEWQVEGSVSSSRVKKKGKTSKSKSPTDRDPNPGYQNELIEPRVLQL